MRLLNHKLFRVLLFVFLMNIDDVYLIKMPSVGSLIVHFLLGFLLVYHLVPSWNKYDNKNKQ
ncbi:MAG: hypothetical protein RI922_1561 [Bacteroidota bacterium]|jgi:hypothetical protein